MKTQNKNYLLLITWVAGLLLIGAIMGSLTRAEITTWYSTLNRSPLTPPDYLFSVAWTILYTILAVCGWILWRSSSPQNFQLIKSLYAAQLILNWSWTPLFFRYHLIGSSLMCLLVMDALVAMIVYLTYKKIRSVSFLMIPYLTWILFATYLNFYIWQYN